jgi:hypothetical protein
MDYNEENKDDALSLSVLFVFSCSAQSTTTHAVKYEKTK